MPITSTPNVAQPSPQASGSVKVKPATFDGTGSWLDYRALFNAVAEINRWSQTEYRERIILGCVIEETSPGCVREPHNTVQRL